MFDSIQTNAFNFNTISHLAVQLLKALHARERDNVEDVLEDKLRIRQSNPLLKGLLLLSETFNVTDLVPAVLKRIEEVKKKTGEKEDIYSGKKTQEGME